MCTLEEMNYLASTLWDMDQYHGNRNLLIEIEMKKENEIKIEIELILQSIV